MNKKKLLSGIVLFLIACFFFLFYSKTVSAQTCYSFPVNDSYCSSEPKNELCCHTIAGCNSTCGWLNWYDWCHVNFCEQTVCEATTCSSWYLAPPAPYPGTYNIFPGSKAEASNVVLLAGLPPSLPPNVTYGYCTTSIDWDWNKGTCSAVDSCLARTTPHLACGLCDVGGCSKCGGAYKKCCSSATGADCPNGCRNSNYSGVCGSGCYPLIGGSCPGGGVTPGITPGITPGVTPSGPNCGQKCSSSGCDACACDGDYRSPSYNWSSLGSSSDCSTCWCGIAKPGITITPQPPTPTPTPRPPTPTPTPVPSCTIGYGPLAISEGETDTLTANVYLQGGATGVNRVDFSSQNEGIATINPSSDSSSPYTTDVTGVVGGSTNVTTTAYINPSGSCVENVPVIVTKPAAWFQTEGGHIYADANIDDNIPDTATDRNLSIAQNSYPGVVAYNPAGSVDLGDGYPSADATDHWLASSSYQGKRFDSWSFFMRKYGDRISENFDGNLPGADGIYYSSTGKTLSSNWDLPANRWLIIMVGGDISVPVDITVPEGSFLAIVAQNDINFTGDVVQAQGMFVADNAIDTGVSDQQLDGEGIFAASTFTFSRDYDDDRNKTTPAEYFTFRPDFLINSFKDPDNNLWWFNSLWQELAP